jgi:hypothetical protein
MLTNVLELDRYRAVHFDFLQRPPAVLPRRKRRPANANSKANSPGKPEKTVRCGRLDLVSELGESPDDPILVLDRHLRRIHQASQAMKHAPPRSWARRYWTRVHRQLKRRRESLDVPWVSDRLNSPGELLWQARDPVLEMRHDY